MFAKSLLNSSMRIVNNLADAEDMVQEAFTDAFRNIHMYHDNVPFEGWLRRICINKSISHLRKNSRYFIDADSLPLANVAEEDVVNEELFALDVQRIKLALSTLPHMQQMVFNMYVLEDLPQSEIAELLGMSHANVRTMYHRTKAKILSIIKTEAYHE